jgi:hypothetical protein
MSTINRDETPVQAAQRTAAAISAFVAATAYRLGNAPLSVVSDAEVETFAAMRDALHDLASHEYDRGFRRAVAMRRDRSAPRGEASEEAEPPMTTPSHPDARELAVDPSRSSPQPSALTPPIAARSPQQSEGAGPTTPTPAGDGETFSQYVTRTRGREEAIRLTAILNEQRRAFPDLMAMTALVRVMADRLASPLRCPACDCRMFVGFHEHATEEDDGPICPVCKPAAATHYLNTP